MVLMSSSSGAIYDTERKKGVIKLVRCSWREIAGEEVVEKIRSSTCLFRSVVQELNEGAAISYNVEKSVDGREWKVIDLDDKALSETIKSTIEEMIEEQEQFLSLGAEEISLKKRIKRTLPLSLLGDDFDRMEIVKELDRVLALSQLGGMKEKWKGTLRILLENLEKQFLDQRGVAVQLEVQYLENRVAVSLRE